jgi:hypothetical protein
MNSQAKPKFSFFMFNNKKYLLVDELKKSNKLSEIITDQNIPNNAKLYGVIKNNRLIKSNKLFDKSKLFVES